MNEWGLLSLTFNILVSKNAFKKVPINKLNAC